MTATKTKSDRRKGTRQPAGFSLLEMIVASAILMVGIISVVQLVPASLQSSMGNRMDTMATVIAQHELDQMLSQPLNPTPPNPPSFTDTNGNLVNLGGPGAPGAAVIMNGQSSMIDFGAGTPPSGFYVPAYVDPNDPTQTSFELRWAVFPQVSNGKVVSRRIIIGCRRTQAVGQLLLPVTLDTSVSWPASSN